MNGIPHNPAGSEPEVFEATLHLLAHAPIPAGIEERVHAALAAAPPHARVLAWSSARTEASWTGAWMRAAAAAAIVVVVVGGGWSVYTHVEHQASNAGLVPAPAVSASPGFASANAIRTPQTVQGPVLTKADTTSAPKAAVAKARAAHQAGQAVAGHAVQAVGR